MTDSTLGTRDKRGNWRPPYIIQKPIFMTWPLKPVAVLKFFFGWPGYLWPWNAFFFAFPLVAWFYMTPPLADMQTFELWWIAIIFARNLGFTVLLFGAWHLWFYVFKAQGTHTKYTLRPFSRNNKVFAFNNQLADNIFWTLGSGVPIWTAYEVVTLWAFANGYVPFIELRTDPVWFVIFMLLIPLIREFHFYFVHRLLHWRPLYELAPQGAPPQRQCRPVGRHVDAPGGACALLLRRAAALGRSLAPAAHDVPPAPRLPLGAPGPPWIRELRPRGQVR